MRSFVDQSALSCNTYSSQNIVAGAHELPYLGLLEHLKNTLSAWLQFVLEYDKTNKIELGFGFAPFHPLYLDPAQFRYVSPCARNDSETSVGIVCQKLIVIVRDWRALDSFSKYTSVKRPTAFRSADIFHAFGSTLDINIDPARPKISHNYT